jgi:hypothetical protein
MFIFNIEDSRMAGEPGSCNIVARTLLEAIEQVRAEVPLHASVRWTGLWHKEGEANWRTFDEGAAREAPTTYECADCGHVFDYMLNGHSSRCPSRLSWHTRLEMPWTISWDYSLLELIE